MSDTNENTVIANHPTAISGQGETPAVAAPQQQNQYAPFIKSLIWRAIAIYAITSFFRKSSTPSIGTSNSTTIAAKNLFRDGNLLSLYVYVSSNETLSDFGPQHVFWYKDGLKYGDWTSGPQQDGSAVIEKFVPMDEATKLNGSLYLHAFVTKTGQSPDPKASNYGKKSIAYATKQLNRFRKQRKSITKNLLTGATTEGDIPETQDARVVSHWHPNLTLHLVTDQTGWVYGSVPAPLDKYLQFTDDGRSYRPVLYANEYWNMARDYKPLNGSDYILRLTYQPLSLFKWQFYMSQNSRNQIWNFLSPTTSEDGVSGENADQDDDDQDTFKETLMHTNPYLLGLTFAVSILHSVFELLAFKNDIQFWNNRNTLEGLSVRSVFFNVFQSCVVLLYVLDNDTNMLVRISCFVGLGIELWKIYKVVDIRIEGGRIHFKDKGSYVESSTRHYDNMAYRYLSWLCFPLLLGYSVYALLYLEHKGWYSFVLSLLYGFLLTFGFIMMTPQLFINYKLKSVAHLPWRMLSYKFLNTFIDDMFAFVIKTPTMYRIGCFRDDIVFLVFLYQWWIYPVDRSRKNEFGYCEQQPSAIDGQPAEGQIDVPVASVTAKDGTQLESKKDK